jgi:hypothetical protein
MSKNRLITIFILAVFLLAQIPTTLGATSSKASKSQDVEWLSLVYNQLTKLDSDAQQMKATSDLNDLNKIYNAAKTFQDDSGKFLIASKKYKVSSKLTKAKSEYEAALSDAKSIGKYFMETVKKTKAGNSKGANAALKSATKYTNSFSKHMDKFIKNLKTYK